MAIKAPDPSGADEPMIELNTTPLIDVLLVLLVMLIISIPSPKHAVNLALPAGAASQIKPQVFVLELLPNEGLRWNGEKLADDSQLQTQLQQAAQISPAPVLHIRPHRQASYAQVAHAMASAQRQGLRQLALLDGFE